MANSAKKILENRAKLFRVLLKIIPGNESEVLICPFPQAKDSPVRIYKKIAYEDIDQIIETGEVYASMGRSFTIADISLKDAATVPLFEVVSSMFDEKIVEPRTSDTWKVEWNNSTAQLKGGIYVMGSCESCWCDGVFC